jgi:hypothetical protein
MVVPNETVVARVTFALPQFTNLLTQMRDHQATALNFLHSRPRNNRSVTTAG